MEGCVAQCIRLTTCRDPLFQRTLVRVVRSSPWLFGGAFGDSVSDGEKEWSGLPVIFDEVFTGIYRLGRFSAASFLGVDPDISVHAKLLTGGVVPLSATLASESIFRAFQTDDKSDALLHGHSYTAHAVGCQVALQSLRELQRMEANGEWDWAKATVASDAVTVPIDAAETPVWSVWSRNFVSWVSHQDQIEGVWALGTVLALHMGNVDGVSGYKSNAARGLQAALAAGSPADGKIHSRVLGNVLYLMAGQKADSVTVERIEGLVRHALQNAAD